MSQVIDTKVVEMQFDNSKFEKNIEVSLNSLKKLVANIDSVGKDRNSLDGLAQAGDKVGMSFENMGAKSRICLNLFDALAGVGTKAFNRISDAVAGFALNMANSLSGMQAMRDGFAEYELKMGSVQTILAGAKIFDANGKSIDDEARRLDIVNQKLEDLNAYSDKTIYSFKDMTANIGKFTNAGVSLDDSVQAIQGVANVAAVSGANASEASRAMYNFSQALSSGAVKLIDWKSIENANMATVEFKQQLLDTAVAMGTVVKEGDMYKTTTTDAQGKVSDLFNSTTKFNDALSNQWMTTEVLTQTLKNYSTDVSEMSANELKDYKDALLEIGYTTEQVEGIVKLSGKAFAAATEVKTFTQMIDTLKESLGSGWAQSFEIIFGNFQEAKALWTDLNNTIDGLLSPIGKARNAILKTWKEDGGREAVINSFKNLYHAVDNLISPAKELWKALTPNTQHSGKILSAISKGIEKLTAVVAKAAGVIGRVIATLLKPIIFIGNLVGKGLLKFVGLIRAAFGKVVEVLNPVRKSFSAFVHILTSAFDKYVTNRIKAVSSALTELFAKIKKNVQNSPVLQNLIKKFGEFKLQVQDLFGRVLRNVTIYASNFVNYLKAIWGALSPLVSSAFTKILQVLGDTLLPRIKNALTFVADKLRYLGSLIGGIDIKNSKLYKGLADLPNRIKNLSNNKSLKTFAKNIKSFGGEAMMFLVEKFESFRAKLESIKMPSGLKNVFDNIKNFIRGVFGEDSIEKDITDSVEKTSKAVEKITGGDSAKKLTTFQKFLQDVTDAFTWFKGAAEKARDAVGTFIEFIVNNTPKAIKSLHDFIAGDDGVITMKDVSDTLYTVANTMAMLLESLGLNKIGDAIDGISGAFGDLAGSVTTLLKRTSNKMKMAALKDFAIAIGILAGAMFLLAQLPTSKMLMAAAAIVVVGYALSHFFDLISTGNMNLMNTAGFIPIAVLILSIGAAMIGVAASVTILVGALAVFPKVIQSYNNLGEEFRTGIERVKEVLSEIFEYLDHTVNAKYGFKSAAAILGLVAALSMIRGTIVKFANQETGDAMVEGLARIKKVIDVLGDFLTSASLASMRFVNIGVDIDFNTIGMAAMIWALGDMMKKLVGPIAFFSTLDENEFKNAFNVISSILLYFGVFLTSVGAVSSLASVGLGQWLGIAANVALLTYAISSVVSNLETIANLAENNAKGLNKALLVLAGIFVGLGALLIIIGKLKPDASVGTLFGLSLSIGVLTMCVYALVPIAATNPEALGYAVLALGSVMVSLGLTLFFASQAAGKATPGDIANLIAMVFAMLVLASAIRRMASVGDPASLTTAGLALGVAALAMAGAMVIINGLSVNPLALVGLLLLTAAIWGIAAAIQAFKGSAGGMSEGAKQVAQGSEEMTSAVEESSDHLAAYAADVVPQFFSDLFGNIGPKIGEAIRNFDLGSYLREKIEQVKADAINWAQDWIDIGTNLIDGISQAISSPDNVAKVKNCMIALGKALVESFKMFLGIASPSTVMIEQGGYVIDGLFQGLMQYPEKLAEWVTGIGQYIIDGIGGFFEGVLEKGQELVQTLGDGIQNGKEFVAEKASALGEAALNKLDKAKEWGAKALASAAEYGAQLQASQNPIKSAAGAMVSGAVRAVNNLGKNFRTIASSATKTFSSQIRSGANPAKAAAAAIVSGAKAAFNGIGNSFKQFGISAAQGFRNGLHSLIQTIADKARELVRRAKNAAKSEQHSNSPSKDFMEYGGWAAEGYAIGLSNRKSTRIVEKNAEAMVKAAKDAASNSAFGMGSMYIDSNLAVGSLAYAMAQISDTVNSDIESSPTIRPIVDMSNVKRNASAITSLFNDKHLDASLEATKHIQSNFDKTMANRNGALSMAAINKLSNKIDGMTKTMNSRQMNNYIQIDGSEDPNAFADQLLNRFKINTRMV